MTTPRVRKALDKISSGEDPLDSLSSHGALTRSGAAWVKCALDPFHDYEITDLDGIPDVETEPTLVVRTQQSISISKPSAITSDTWDCNIVNMPVDFSCSTSVDKTTFGTYFPQCTAGGPAPGTFNAEGNTIYRMDGLQISTAAAGDPTFNTTSPQFMLGLDDYIIAGSATDLVAYRVVSSGFEVVNTSAALERSGACTVYEIGSPGEISDINLQYAPDNIVRLGTVRNFRMPPVSLAEAKQTPGARTWHAEEGCYVVSKHRSEMSFSPVAKRDYVYAASDDTRPSWTCFGAGRSVVFNGAVAPVSERDGCASHISNLNTSGAYFTGLSSNTTLQVTWRVVLERLPGPFDLQNLALASPSAVYDPRALELYSHITAMLPPGVPVGYNDAGKYFKMIARQIRAAIHQTLPLMPVVETAVAAAGYPVAAAALEGARVGAAAAQKKQNAEKNKKKPSVPNHGKP